MTQIAVTNSAGPVAAWLESKGFQRFIMAVIVFNAITLGLDTAPGIVAQYGSTLSALDTLFLSVFVIELALRISVQRMAFFKDGWNLFDFVIVAVSLLPHNEVFSVLRVLRVFRLLRLVTLIPSLRVVVEGLLSALPGMGSVSMLLALLIYVGAVMVTKLFGVGAPEQYGSLDRSIFSLLQVMTLDGWPDMARAAMKTNPYAWLFFLGFIVVTTFTALNLFVGVIVTAMEERVALEKAALHEVPEPELSDVMAVVKDLKGEVAALRDELQRARGAPPG